MVRLNPSLQDPQVSGDGEASVRTDTYTQDGAGPRQRTRHRMATCIVAEPELQR